MMTSYSMTIHLRSEATFGRGDGVAGVLDQEVEHDANGFPYLRGRTLKGALSEACDNLVAVLPRPMDWETTLVRLFGRPGSTWATLAHWHIGDACLPADLRQAVAQQQAASPDALTPVDILQSLTTVRRRTAMDATKGTPEEGSLRSVRVILRDLIFTSLLETNTATANDLADDLTLLAAGCLALRHLGVGRTRGRGWVRCTLHDAAGSDITEAQFHRFAARLTGTGGV